MTDSLKHLKLSPIMIHFLKYTPPGARVRHGGTRAALIRRGLVSKMDTGPAHAARLTQYGRDVRETLLAEQVRP